jgi:hypothetical protein
MRSQILSLHEHGDDELLAELARRERARTAKEPPEQWCDDCVHFIPAGDLSDDDLDEYNPCAKGHKMKFHPPEDMAGVCGMEFGFYRNNCRDSKPREEA